MPEKLKMVTVLIAFLYDGLWRSVGDHLEMEAGRADALAKKSPPLVAFGEHVVEVDSAGVAGDVSQPGPVVFDPPDFPGADQLLLAGIKSAAEVRQLITAKGDAWFADIPGIGKKIAGQIGAAIGPIAAAEPAPKPAAEPAPKPAAAAAAAES